MEAVFSPTSEGLVQSEPGSPTPTDTVVQQIRDRNGRAGQWRQVNFVGRDLRGLDFSGCDLAGCDFSNTDLRDASFAWAKLEGAVFFQAKLDRVEFVGAQLQRANFEDADAPRVGLGGAQLQGASFARACLRGATLSQAALNGADFRSACLSNARIRDAVLTSADFTQSDLRNVDLRASQVHDAVFNDADLRRAHVLNLRGFERASWIGADIRDVDFCGAYRIRRHIADENYLYEFRTQSRGATLLYWLWWLTSDCGRSLSRWSLWTVLVAVIFAFLYSVVGMDYGEHPTSISPLYYSVVTLTTLGYGDVLPASVAGQVLAMLEVILGYMALGGLLSIFSNKMARRAD